MALVVADRVQETTSTTGTSDYALLGAAAGYQSFGAVLADADTTYYAITNDTDWEVGIGTYSTTGPTLARTTILASSNSGSAVNWGAGVKNIFISYAAGKASFFDANGDLPVADKIVHAGDTDTAIRFPSANTMSVETGGTERFKVENSTITTTVPITLPADPTLPLQAATKEYVDTIASAGIHYHAPVRVESPTNLNATYNNGTSGVGATLTNAGAQAALVIDGVTVATNDRVLIYTQTDQTQNGVYVVTDTGSGSTNWVLTRSTDTDSYGASDPNALGAGDAFFVQQGATGAGELYVCNTAGTITFGTTNITFTQIAATAVYTAGSGLTLTGTEFSNAAPDQTVTLTQGGATTITGTYPNFTITSTDTTYSAGNGIGLAGTTFSVAAGSGLTQDASGLSHAATSSQSSVDNTGATFIQDVNLDSFGHVTGLASVTVTPSLIGAPQNDGTGATGTWNISISGNAANVNGTVAVGNGGTGATTTGQARTNLDVPSTTGSGASGTWGINVTGNAGSSTLSVIQDTRSGALTPNDYADYRVSYEFTNQVIGSDWHTAITPKGWHDGYAAWQLWGPSSTSAHENWYLRSGVNTTWNPLRTILHSGNYNSFAPTLTGTGASGTWSINVTGNAATATTADQIDGWAFSNTGSNFGVNADTLDSNGVTYYTAGVPNFTGNATDGALYSQAYSSSWQHQIAGDYRSGQVALRGKNNGTWQSWRTVLDSSNYTSYAPSLTGSGASGTWGIAISGNAATATSASTDWLMSNRDFPNGTLITTSIDYSVTNGDPFVLEIRGNSYGNLIPLDFQYQGYIYADTIINHGGLSNGYPISGLVALNVGGNLCFWFPTQGYWQGYTVRAYTAYSGNQPNRVTSITSVSKPSGTKEVALSSSVRQSLHSSNYTSYAPSLTGSGASGTWGINVTGNAATVSSITNITGLTRNSLSAATSLSSLTTSNFRSTLFGSTTGGFNLAAGRWEGTPSALSPLTFYGTMMAWSGSDTHGFLALSYDAASAKIGGGNANNIIWSADLIHSSNYTSYSPTLTGGGASGTWSISVSGNAATATNLSTNRTNWSSNGTISAVVGQLAWKNYNNNHTIFDASNSTSPDGTSVNNTNAQIGWAASYPTLMGWNGSETYGVRVDSARVSDSAGSVAWGNVSSKPSNIMYYQGFTLDANTMDSNSTGFTYSVNAPATGPVTRISAGGGYDLWLNAPYSGGNALYFRTRNGDTSTSNPWRTVIHDGNYTSYTAARNGSGYLIPDNWIQLNGFYGLYSGNNGAHFYPNDASYGSWKVIGTRNGWAGLEFQDSNTSLMQATDGNLSGFHRNGYGWQFYWQSGTLYCHKNTYGGGTGATVLDSSNFGGILAGLGADAVGSYAFLVLLTDITANYAPGTTFAGSALRFAGITSTASGSLSNMPRGSAPSGTWRNMGYLAQVSSSGGPGSQRQTVAVFLRIS